MSILPEGYLSDMCRLDEAGRLCSLGHQLYEVKSKEGKWSVASCPDCSLKQAETNARLQREASMRIAETARQKLEELENKKARY